MQINVPEELVDIIEDALRDKLTQLREEFTNESLEACQEFSVMGNYHIELLSSEIEGLETILNTHFRGD